jgi:hypothetical protein
VGPPKSGTGPKRDPETAPTFAHLSGRRMSRGAKHLLFFQHRRIRSLLIANLDKFMSTMSRSSRTFVLDAFGLRQFNNPSYTGTQIHYDPEEFEKRINEIYDSGRAELKDGYAPFCKHLFVENFANVTCGYVKKTAETKALIETSYESRQDGELAVLVEYISRDKLPPPMSTHLDIILYSREQIIKENIAMNVTPPDTDAPWGIISIKGQLCDFELPMQPITSMRNALGREEGGSGVRIDRVKYQQSVDFWSDHVSIK